MPLVCLVCGDAAMYFDPYSSIELAFNINKLMQSKDLYLQQAKKGISHAKEFKWSYSVKQIYEQLKKSNAD
jgi:hypothetical protein